MKRRKQVILCLFLAVCIVFVFLLRSQRRESEPEDYEIVQVRADIDFSSNPIAEIKPLHGVNNGPKTEYALGRFWHDGTRFFQEAGIPYVRTHDIEYPYGQNLFIDIHCIFPDFNADPSLETSYHFDETDRYIQAILESGSQVFFRLGESIDHSGDNLYINPPSDYKKWAQICEGIINHYNNGFADGFYYNIEYWEIWNEPEGGAMWTGTPEQFYELYKVSAAYLKEKFPDLKIGGYGATVSNQEFFEDFLKYMTQDGEQIPLDFFSFHVYASDPSWVAASCQGAEDLLKKYGYYHTELILDEWNYNDGVWDEEGMKEEYRQVISQPRGAAYMAAVLITMQNCGLDKAMYYDTQFMDIWNGLYTTGIFGVLHPLPGLNSFSYFNQLYQVGNQIEILAENAPSNLYLCGVADDSRRLVLAANYGTDTDMGIEVVFQIDDEPCSTVTVLQTDNINPNGAETKIEQESNLFTWTLPPDSVALFEFE